MRAWMCLRSTLSKRSVKRPKGSWAHPVGRWPVRCGLLAEPITFIRNRRFAPLKVNRALHGRRATCRALVVAGTPEPSMRLYEHNDG
jgi:hypothetical protein